MQCIPHFVEFMNVTIRIGYFPLRTNDIMNLCHASSVMQEDPPSARNSVCIIKSQGRMPKCTSANVCNAWRWLMEGGLACPSHLRTVSASAFVVLWPECREWKFLSKIAHCWIPLCVVECIVDVVFWKVQRSGLPVSVYNRRRRKELKQKCHLIYSSQ